MQWIALAIILASAAWLIGIAGLMALRPGRAIGLLQGLSRGLEAGNWRVNLTEQGLRILAGTALIVRASEAKWPTAFSVAGWVLVCTSLFILALPIRWHGAYGNWWGERLKTGPVRLLSPLPLAVGVGLAYAAL